MRLTFGLSLSVPWILATVTASAEVEPWVGAGMAASPAMALSASGEDGFYDRPSSPVGLWFELEPGLAVSETVSFSLAPSYGFVLDLDSEAQDDSVEATELHVPVRVRFLGIGGPEHWVHGLFGIGYTASWDENQQGATSGGSLRSSGFLMELGGLYRADFTEKDSLEIGLILRLQLMGVSNGEGVFDGANVTRLSAPIRVHYRRAF